MEKKTREQILKKMYAKATPGSLHDWHILQAMQDYADQETRELIEQYELVNNCWTKDIEEVEALRKEKEILAETLRRLIAAAEQYKQEHKEANEMVGFALNNGRIEALTEILELVTKGGGV
jgi:uncharacterized coiled-coil DUF342 family protein